MYNPKPPLPTPGQGRIFYKGAVHKASWVKEKDSSYEIIVTLENQTSFRVDNSDDRLGIVYQEGDSGNEMYNVFVPLADNEQDPVGTPDEATLKASAFMALEPIFNSVAEGETHPDDLNFCRLIFNSPEMLLRAIQSTGNLENARKDILKRIFNINA